MSDKPETFREKLICVYGACGPDVDMPQCPACGEAQWRNVGVLTVFSVIQVECRCCGLRALIPTAEDLATQTRVFVTLEATKSAVFNSAGKITCLYVDDGEGVGKRDATE